MITNFLWRVVAWIVSRPRVADWLIARSRKTPYKPITSRDRSRVYMWRHWLFNPYGKDTRGEMLPARWSWLPSIRVHHINLADDAAHMHDHPWVARTVILRGWYEEYRLVGSRGMLFTIHDRRRGYTGRILPGDFHHITAVSQGGAWTLFFTWGKEQSWGFNVEGKKVPWREYLGEGA